MARYGNRKLFLVLVVLFLGSTVHAKRGPKHLTLYAQESYVPPSNTFIVSASPTGNYSGADEFGLLRTISNTLTETSDRNSKIIGKQTGIIVVGKDSLSIYFSFTYFLNANATHQGTIAVQGHIDVTSVSDKVYAVVGGTGDFFGVIGKDVSAVPPPNPPDPAHVLDIHNVTLLYRSD